VTNHVASLRFKCKCSIPGRYAEIILFITTSVTALGAEFAEFHFPQTNLKTKSEILQCLITFLHKSTVLTTSYYQKLENAVCHLIGTFINILYLEGFSWHTCPFLVETICVLLYM